MELLVKATEQHTLLNMMPLNTNNDEKVVDEIDGFTISAFNEKPVQRIEQQNCTSIQISRDISEDVSEDVSGDVSELCGVIGCFVRAIGVVAETSIKCQNCQK